MIQSNPRGFQQFTGVLRTGSLLILGGLSLGVAVTDLVDRPHAVNQFLDDGGVRSFVDERWWIFMLVALLVYVGRLALVLHNRHLPRAFVWIVPIEFVAGAILAGVTALGLSWLSVEFYSLCP